MTGTNLIAVYKPLGWQIAPWRDRAGVLLLTGSAGGGKSRLAAEKIHAYLKKYPGATGAMLRKNRTAMTNSTVLFMERTIMGSDPHVQHFSSKHRFEYRNGSILAYGGMADDEQREQIRSIGAAGGLDIAWMEEANAFSEDDYNELRGRIRGRAAPWRQLILTTNPDSPMHWVKRRLMDGGEAAVYYSRAADNPNNPPEYLDTLASMTGVLEQRLNRGLWVQAEGAVYENFDSSIHVIDPFPIPAEWRRIRVIDFGYTNPFVCQWWAFDNDGRMYLYREIYMSQRTVSVHAKQIKALSVMTNAKGEEVPEPIEVTVCDHDAEDRATLSAEGIPNMPALKDVSPGIQRVAQRLNTAHDGRPRLAVFKNALVEVDRGLEARRKPISTVQEFPGYVWPKDDGGRAIKEAPVKLDDHGMDTLRYAVMYADGPLTRVEYAPSIWG